MAKPKFDPSFSAAAGEHFVAARLAAMGFMVAMPRGGSPSVDLLVSTPDGRRTLGVQVKTGKHSQYIYKRKKKPTNWSWPMGLVEEDSRVLHIFVDLQDWTKCHDGFAQCYILSPDEVAKYRRIMNQ